jgi:UDP-N-acetylmuramate--alanine ligase
MNLDNIGLAYFLGIGGIGMSSLARFLHAQGVPVCGYDKTETELTKTLETEGIPVSTLDSVQELTGLLGQLPVERVVVIRTPAVPQSHPQLQFFEASGYRIIKRSEMLGWITATQPTLAVAGTHGKTTTSTWLAHILRNTVNGCNAFLGGIDLESGSNLIMKAGAPWTVVEADEFDRSFHQLRPMHAVITGNEPDHLDIYGTAEAFAAAFDEFAGLVTGQVLVAAGTNIQRTDAQTYGVVQRGAPDAASADWDFAAVDAHVDGQGFMVTDFRRKGQAWLEGVRLSMAGWHNCANGLAAAVLANWAGASDAEIRAGLAGFRGIRRRFNFVVRTDERVYIDDYAHHPTEVRAAIEAARLHHPGREVTVIFQPHLFSRTRDQGAGFARDLALADCLYLLPIYPAREEPMEGIHSQWLFDKISHQDKHLIHPEEIFRCLEERPPEVLLTLGAGDIDRLVEPLKQLLINL